MIPLELMVANPFNSAIDNYSEIQGTVAGMKLETREVHYRRRGGTVLGFTVEMPTVAAGRIIDYFEDNFAAGKRTDPNCLSFAEAVQGRPHSSPRLRSLPAPVLPTEQFSSFAVDENNLVAGTSYGLVTPDRELFHAVVGIGMPNRHLEVYGRRGWMQIADTQRTMENFEASEIVVLNSSYL